MRSWMRWSCVLVGAFALQAAAQGTTRATRFGNEGTLALSTDLRLFSESDLTLGAGYTTVDDADTGYIFLRPAVDYFVAPDISVGGVFRLGATFADGFDTTAVGFGARVGINLPLEGRLSLWPRFSALINFDTTDTAFGDVTDTYGEFDLFAPFLFHPGSNFFVGLGPALAFSVGDRSGVTFEARSMLGGYF